MPIYLRIRYLCDRAAAVAALLVVSPILLGLAVWVRLVDGRPILYWSERVVAGHRVVPMPKIRTFKQSHDPASLRPERAGAYRSAADSPDLIPGARLVRALGLDELPQLWLVASGEMGIIGPRPQPPEYSDLNEWRPPWLRPGLISLATASGRRSLPLEERLKLDQQYAEKASLLTDLGVVLRTIVSILRRVE